MRFWNPDYQTLVPFIAGISIGITPALQEWWMKAFGLIAAVGLIFLSKSIQERGCDE